MSFKTRSPLH